MAIMQVLVVCASIASPVGINQLLQYLEMRGEGLVVRPWVWVLWLLLAPMVKTVAGQWYIFLSVRLPHILQLHPCSLISSAGISSDPGAFSPNSCLPTPSVLE